MTNDEYTIKRARIAELIEALGLTGLALGRAAGWSWASGGGEATVGLNSEHAAALLLFTPRRDYLLASRIELPRLLAEEIGGLPLEPIELPWEDPARRAAVAVDLAGGTLGSDTPNLPGARQLAAETARLRQVLTPAEQARFAALGRAAGEAIEAAAQAVAAGMSEREIAGRLAAEVYQRDATPVVLLVAVDERIDRVRHPVPTTLSMKHRALLVLCARRHGLIASASRMVHVGPPPAELRRRAHVCAELDALLHTGARPGRTLGALFADLQAAYTAAGFPDAWRDHHQGGLTGYENREALALPGSALTVQVGQAYAWNPSLAGAKSEDTIIITAAGHQTITATGSWPQTLVEIAGQTVERPAVLEL